MRGKTHTHVHTLTTMFWPAETDREAVVVVIRIVAATCSYMREELSYYKHELEILYGCVKHK